MPLIAVAAVHGVRLLELSDTDEGCYSVFIVIAYPGVFPDIMHSTIKLTFRTKNLNYNIIYEHKTRPYSFPVEMKK